MDSLCSAAWPSQWPSPEGLEFHEVMVQVKAAGFKVLAACTSADSVGGDFHAAIEYFEVREKA